MLQKMRLQCHRRDNMFKRIKGALACYNTECPARLQRHTTVNGDANGAKNIGLIGFSKLVSSDDKPLPPFCRSKKSRFDLANEFEKFFLPERKDFKTETNF
ncbi:uncharacterized protein EV154DRAFT_483085 [Mucor mucedo]|uniref:uncharacterized protein n=1 Tax=Mucor mucedo TaxID=29922 RepID=UPI00221E7E6E|nr:uncharacterized protein EV154DRAFT_483085 [Mucor mucedo]KAI7889496.1 hypothetical protein EV154DRAFT_483085 [Mucor mucedo]